MGCSATYSIALAVDIPNASTARAIAIHILLTTLLITANQSELIESASSICKRLTRPTQLEPVTAQCDCECVMQSNYCSYPLCTITRFLPTNLDFFISKDSLRDISTSGSNGFKGGLPSYCSSLSDYFLSSSDGPFQFSAQSTTKVRSLIFCRPPESDPLAVPGHK